MFSVILLLLFFCNLHVSSCPNLNLKFLVDMERLSNQILFCVSRILCSVVHYIVRRKIKKYGYLTEPKSEIALLAVVLLVWYS